VNVDALQLHLTNLSRILRDGGGKTTANELDEFVQLLEPHRNKKMKELFALIANAEEIIKKGVAPGKQAKTSTQDLDRLSAHVVDLYNRASDPAVSREDIIAAFVNLDKAKPTVKFLEQTAKQIGIVEKLKKPDLLKKMRQTVLDRKGSTDRIGA
jgi:hypothetical protein